MSERYIGCLTGIIRQLDELLCKMSNPAAQVYNTLDAMSEAERRDKALRRAAHQAQDLFEDIVSAACAAENALEELKGGRDGNERRGDICAAHGAL